METIVDKKLSSGTLSTGIFYESPIWKWDIIGDNHTLIIDIPKNISSWIRFWTKVFFGSKWKRAN